MIFWFDVEDLFHYAPHHARPSGIQRLSYEMYVALHDLLGERARFVRHDPVGRTLREVPWEAVRTLYEGLVAPRPASASAPAPALPAPPRARPARAALRRVASHLPVALREPLALAARSQAVALISGVRAVRALPSLLRPPPGVPVAVRGALAAFGGDIREAARPGDVIVTLGSPWSHPDYAGFVGGIARALGLRTALLVYDLIPLVRPEWFDQGLVRVFRESFEALAPVADIILAISHATARDVEAWSARSGVAVALPVRVLPIGTGFSGPPVEEGAALPAGLVAGGYALFVSTVEARKNHLLAFRAWRRMVEEMGPERVPVLVFAGRVGWLVADLMEQLANCGWLGGKVVMVPDPTDGELAALYRGCRFTLFPSLYEGWGLPVTESLSFGKVCVASDRTSIPEAGGRFCLYLDPEDITAATDVIRRACTDDALIAAMEAGIRDGFRPTPWRETAEALVASLDPPRPPS